ncbi:MAG: nucleotidyltransferase domain-containing protein [Agathobacter sp.]|nr:nucleotidyltransferase domain-containing protein [Agathobacter sp.]
MEQIIEYIKQEYNPLSIILYGSYADGSNNMNSDFDALVISDDHEQFHDTSIISEVPLDVFVYPIAYFEGDYDCNDFIQIFDGKIIVDNEDKGKILQKQILSYLEERQHKSKEEIQANIDWCMKMFERVKRCDAEGMFRWHWVLIDSLEIFCDMTHHPYFGPKKALKWMEENYPAAYVCYEKALKDFSMKSLENWLSYLKTFEYL